MKVLTGCSGYEYDDWKESFYPEDLAKKEWLQYYSERFATVEINNTFYQLPSDSTLRSWQDHTPADFLFSLKGSRYVTQMKKLKDPVEPVGRFYAAAEKLGDKLACILWQCPGNFKRNTERLEAFCQALSRDFTNVIELRHPSWWDDRTYEILEKYKVVFCMVSAPDDLPEAAVQTAETAYLRFHGKNKWYDHRYSKKELQAWAKKCSDIKVRRLYAYFNNDVDANAPANAREFSDMTAAL